MGEIVEESTLIRKLLHLDKDRRSANNEKFCFLGDQFKKVLTKPSLYFRGSPKGKVVLGLEER